MGCCGASVAPARQPDARPAPAGARVGNVKYVPGQPFTKPMGSPARQTTVAAMQPAQAIQMSSQLKRIFLGLAWTNAKSGRTVDVDASCIAFSQGQEVEAVCFHTLRNPKKTLAHTGDVLVGGNDAKKSDMERIYIWLEKADPAIDMILMVANVFSNGADFASLREAYVRVANADTNQELGRLWLGGDSWSKMGAGNNAVVFAKAYRYMGHWQVMMLGQPLNVPGASDYKAMVPAIQKLGLALPPPPPAAAAVAAPGQQKPTRVWPCAALAAASTAGVAAAVAIFMAPQIDLGMLDAGLFEGGVDFGSLAVPSVVDAMDLGSVEDLGDWAGEATEAAGEAAAGASEWAAGAAEAAGELAGEAAGAVGEGAGDATGAVGGAIQEVQESGDALGGLMAAVGQLAEGLFGGGDD